MARYIEITENTEPPKKIFVLHTGMKETPIYEYWKQGSTIYYRETKDGPVNKAVIWNGVYVEVRTVDN